MTNRNKRLKTVSRLIELTSLPQEPVSKEVAATVQRITDILATGEPQIVGGGDFDLRGWGSDGEALIEYHSEYGVLEIMVRGKGSVTVEVRENE